MKTNSGHLLFLLITMSVTLLPMIIGLCTWTKLPETVPIHFGLDGKPNGWAPKWVPVFILPLLLAVIQLIVYFSMEAVLSSGVLGLGFYRIIMLLVPLCAVICTVVIYLKILK